MVEILAKREEKHLNRFQKNELAFQFRKAILAEDLPEITRLCKKYSPHHVYAAFEDTPDYPHEVSVFHYSRLIAEGDNDIVSDATKQFMMLTIMWTFSIVGSASLLAQLVLSG